MCMAKHVPDQAPRATQSRALAAHYVVTLASDSLSMSMCIRIPLHACKQYSIFAGNAEDGLGNDALRPAFYAGVRRYRD